MTREEAIEVYNGLINVKIREAFEFFVPELRGSKNEKIRKDIISLVNEWWDRTGTAHPEFSARGEMLAYLEEQKPTPVWMPKFLDELRSKKNYFDWDEHRDIEGHILAIIKWIAPDYFDRKEEAQKPLPGFDDLTPDEKMNHPLYLEGFDAGLEVGRVEAEQKPGWSDEDEKMVETICKEGDLKPSEQRWLKSLKNRGNSPKGSANSPWKPSKEQMDKLFSIVAALRKDYCDDMADFLANLYKDLKKLM